MIDYWGLDETKPISADKNAVAFWQVGGVLYEFYRRPQMFRLSYITDWVDEYESFGIPEKYKDCHPVWIDLMYTYRPFYAAVVSQKEKESQQNGQ